MAIYINSGSILNSEVSAQIMVRAYLSGMPECKFGLNDKVMMENSMANSGKKTQAAKVQLDDCQFHQCVKLGKFDAERTINFIPPDGEFELMRYRTSENLVIPFKVRALVNEVSANKAEFKVSLKALFGPKIHAQSIIVKIPAPLNTAKTRIDVQGGKAKYSGSENCFVWKYT
jgi:AP-2 complex subunit mu-1